ncbi:purine and uridine phosphorylase [Viridothelium virens]|uniref:Purine and uridine phosphorylase n=1 Tax=Viridothelium virens TaxID=1048519 RepID=A0A6A6GXR0_VIRVR|nr:purine and uridine phosphorylase [Viridothelium virens]
MSNRPRHRDDFDIAIICALSIEADAVLGVFDEFWEEEGDSYGKAASDSNTYTTGRIGKHNVVLAHMPGMGKNASASVAANFCSSFNCIRLGLVVGICGGVPADITKGEEMLLGDVVISTGVVQFDFGRQYSDKVIRKDTLEDGLGRQNLEIRGFLQKMGGLHDRKQLKDNTFFQLSELCRKDDFHTWGYPGASNDILYPSTYRHMHQQSEACEICGSNSSCEAARESSCEELSCDTRKQIPRSGLQKIEEQGLTTETGIVQRPEIHFGKIGSGDLVIKSENHRDDIAKKEKVIAFEMEGAGVWDHFPTVVIKGVCDYADSHKNKKWQKYAAATAAACMKAFLKVWRGMDKPLRPSASLDQSSSSSFKTTLGTRYPEGKHPLDGLPSSLNDGEPALKRRKTDSHPDHQVDFDALRHTSEARRKLNQFEPIALSTDQRRIYLNSLKFHQIESRHANIKPAHTKTCKWLLKKSEYQDWLDACKIKEHNGIFWIKGKPAAGKSTIMKFAYSNSKRNMKNAIVVSFYFNARGEDLERNVEGMYRSLLFQLLSEAQELQHVFDILGPDETDEYESVKWSIEKLRGFFERAVENLKQRHLVCFIDGLDECNEGEVRDMVEFFERLAQVSVMSGTQLHVCFSSRHYPYITIEKGVELTLEGQEGHLQDIINYVQSELRAGQSKVVRQIKDEIPQRACGIFLWAVLVVKMLQKEFDRGKVYALQKRFNQIPTELFELFNDILTRDGEQVDDLILCLQWILLTKRPLKREELYFGLLSGLATEALAPWDPKEVTEQDMERFILHSSKGLAEVTKSKAQSVQFIHESVRDFLKEGRLELLSGEAFLKQGHERLKQCCQTYLRVNASEYLPLTTNLPAANSEAAADLRRRANERLPLLEYAVRNILHHSNAASRDGICQDSFVQGFTVQDWVLLDNLFERFQVRRHTPEVSLLYILVEKNLPDLIAIELQRVQHMDIPGERYEFPLCVGVAKKNEEAVKALITPNVSVCSNGDRLPDLCLSPETVLWPLNDAYRSWSKRSQTPLFWAASGGHEAVVKLLVASEKVDVDLKDNNKDNNGRTPLL